MNDTAYRSQANHITQISPSTRIAIENPLRPLLLKITKLAIHEIIGIEGDDKAEWILVDFGEVIVQIMVPATREFYDIERLWSIRPNDSDEI